MEVTSRHSAQSILSGSRRAGAVHLGVRYVLSKLWPLDRSGHARASSYCAGQSEMTVRQTFFGVGFVAALASAFFALMPARTTVQVSALPDFPGLDVVLRVGGSLGLSLSADEQSIRVECGSPAVRKKFDAENHNVIQEIFESAQRLLKAIRNACDAVVDPRRNAALGLGGGSAILLLAAAVAGGRSRAAAPRTRQVVGSPAAPPGWYPGPGGTSGHLWWDGSAWHAAVEPAGSPR